MSRTRLALTSCLALLACDGSGSPAKPALTREELLDPKACMDCHPKHYREWSASMHAYAATDPVFLAMNRRGQRETRESDEPLGKFCIQCHAPMAVREMPDADFTELEVEDLPDHLKGVTCYFCHNAVGVGDDHFNANIELANDTTMRGGIRDPVQPAAHRAEYSEYHDRLSKKSALLCGSCHDIVTPKGVHLERTLKEWESSVFAKPGISFQTCQGCHMNTTSGVAADDPDTEVPFRRRSATSGVHEHLWAAVDVALTDFPERRAMELAVEHCELANSIGYVELRPAGDLEFVGLTLLLETNAGHGQPSGATQDRRMWVEFIAYDAEDNVIFESGTIEDDELEEKPADDPEHDPNLWLMRDRIFDEDDAEVHMFWEAARYDDTQNPVLPVAKPLPAGVPILGSHSLSTSYRFNRVPARATIRVRVRPIGLDVLQELVDSRDLDASVRDAMPTFTAYSAEAEWPDPSNPGGVVLTETTERDCKTYKCMLDPEAEGCGN